MPPIGSHIPPHLLKYPYVMFHSKDDRRVCSKCRSYHGTVWRTNETGRPIPPLHPGCRCWLTYLWESPIPKEPELPRQPGVHPALPPLIIGEDWEALLWNPTGEPPKKRDEE